ncbi:MAG TPA: PIG-L deacetylase family protein [Chthonomonadaceae bacterium]|nr:PIG-L deacetylase family protein [Chthonomonadaceae bacterium]
MASQPRIVAVFAHPDDESLLAGGTLAACAARGAEVSLICATRGGDGPISDPALATRATLAAVREAELRNAAVELGLRSVACLDYPDGMLPWVERERITADLAARLGRARPDAILTFGAEGLYWHPDHIAIHEITRDAWRQAAAEGAVARLYYATWPAGLAQDLAAAMADRCLPADLWGLLHDAFGVPPSMITTTLDVREYVPQKLRALRCHRTQLAAHHLFSAIPDDLAVQLLGCEYFVREAGEAAEPDRLTAIVCG